MTDKNNFSHSFTSRILLRWVCIIAFAVLAPVLSQASLDILIVGSSHSFSEGGESGVLHEKPFNPTAIASELQSILTNDSAIVETVNVVFDDIYKSETRYVQTSKTGYTTWDLRCYSLAQHYMWPTGKTNRLDNLRGAAGTAWDYVVIVGDPYVIANFPGMYVEGAEMLVDEINDGTAEPILLAQWPENSSTFDVSYFNEVVYRMGVSKQVRVIPAGKGWDSLSPQDSSTSHPTPDGAYLAAASIYSELFNKSAKTTSSYTYDDAIADHALSNIQTNNGVSQYSGVFTNLNVFTMKYVPKRLVSFRETGTSTEDYLRDALSRLDDRCGMTFTTTATHDPTDWDFNYGRGNDWWEDDKDYSVNPSIYDRSYGFPMHYYGVTNAIKHMAYGIDKQYYYGSYNDGTDLGIAYNMIRPGTREDSLPADVRAIPIRLLYTKMAEVVPGYNPLHDATHMHFNLNDASVAFMYTLLSGRCPLVDEPAIVSYAESSDWMRWLGNKIGYETAWRMAHVTTRVPGFQVMPSSTDDSVTPSIAKTLAVKFWYAPTSDVTVAVSTDDLLIGKATPSTLTFTPSNYSNAQTVTVIGQTGSAGTHEFNINLTTSSTDPVCDNLSDSWEFHNTRPEGPLPSDIRVFANDQLIWSGDMDPIISDASHYGVLAGPGSRTFTITNISDLATVNLTGTPDKVTLTDLSGCFVLTQDATLGALTPGGAATTFDISCTPPAPGLHTALVSVASTDWAVPDYSFMIAAIFADASPTVANQTTTSSSATTATLPGILTDGGGAEAWICWGETDGGTGTTSAWENVVSMGTVFEGGAFSADLTGLIYGVEYERRVYVSNYAGTSWSTLASFTTKPPTPVVAVRDTGVDLITTTTADLHGQFDATNSVFTVNVYWSTINHSDSAAWLGDGSAMSANLGTFTNVFNYDLSTTATGLTVGTTYYYSFRISNEAADIWVTPNGSFAAASAPTAHNATGASVLYKNSATLRGTLSDGSGANAWICWGDNDAGNGSTGDWDNVVAIGPVLEGQVFSCIASGLETNGTYWYRTYVANGAGIDWSDSPEIFAGTPAELYRAEPVVLGWNYTEWTGDIDSGIDSEFTYTAAHCFGNNHSNVTVNGVEFEEAWVTNGTGWDIGATLGNQWNGDYTAAISGGSEDLAEEMLYNVNPRPITFLGLIPGTVYEASLFSVGWENGTRNLPCSAEGSGITNIINQDAYGNENGIRITYTFQATNTYQRLLVASSGFHLYAIANREVPPALAIVNTSPISITNDHAVVGATLNADGAEYDVYAYWGTSDGGSNSSSWISSAYVGSWTNAITNISHIAGGLVSGQTHYYTFLASNATTTAWATPSWQFAVPADADPNLPAIGSYAGATDITATSALLIGSLTSTGGSATTVTCYWNANSDPGATAVGWDYNASFGVAAGTRDYTNDTAETAALLQGTTYYYRYRAANSHGTNWSSVASFTTLIPPTVANAAGATPLSETSAVLLGELTIGASATAWICWGDTDGGTGSTGSWDNVVSMGPVTQGITFSNVVSSLATNATYWYRCFVVNGAGSDWSDAVSTFNGMPTGNSGGWTPAEIATVAWFDADDASTIGLNGSLVTNWLDKSGNGHHASQASGGAPTYTSADSIANDMPSIQNLGASGGIGMDTPSFSAKNVYVVTYYDTGTESVFNNGGNYPTLLSGPGGYGQYRVMGWLNEAKFYNTSHFNDAGTYKNGSTNSSLEGVLPMPASIFKFKASSARTQVYGLGYNQDQSGRDWQGAHCEWIFTDGSEDAATEQMIEGYLAHKWGLAADLPVGHTYKTSPPGDAGVGIANAAPTGITASNATLNASLNASGTNYDVYVYYGTSDGGTNAGSWISSASVGSWTNVSTNASYGVSSLTAVQTYYYTFMASNTDGVVWSSPSWQFSTTGSAPATTNYSVPYSWLAGIDPNWTNDYEDAALDDPDGDGFTTWQEYWSGTDPTNGTSYLKIDAVSFDGVNITLEWQHDKVVSLPPIQILRCTNLADNSWVVVDSQAPVNGTNTWMHGSLQRVFYRLSVTASP